MNCGQLCVREVDVAEPGESVRVVAQRMQARNVGTLVVIDRLNRPAGIVTDRDLDVRVLAQSRGASETTVEQVMTRSLKTICENVAIEDGLRVMRAGHFRRIPVVDSLGNFVGIISLDDILGLLSEELNAIEGLLREESPAVLDRG